MKKILKKIFIHHFNDSIIVSKLISKLKKTPKKKSIKRFLIQRKLFKRYSISINKNAKIKDGLQIVHPHGVFITNASLGSNVKIYQNVTIGRKESYNEKDVPTIGDNVIIYANAVIVGNVTIGNNSIIGAGAVVVNSFPENSIIVGNPGRNIKKA